MLPLSHSEMASEFGTRHRAGLGITEETDAVALVVSEETGEIAIASGGRLEKPVPAEALERLGGGADPPVIGLRSRRLVDHAVRRVPLCRYQWSVSACVVLPAQQGEQETAC